MFSCGLARESVSDSERLCPGIKLRGLGYSVLDKVLWE